MKANTTKLRGVERLYNEGRFYRAISLVVFGALVVIFVLFPMGQLFFWFLVIDLLTLGFISLMLSDYRRSMKAVE